ncbi:MAG: sugar-binding domain-containing protein, partial [Gemmataceae bacterium]
MRWTTLLLVLALPLVAKAEPETWKPARGPLLTRWASEVKPDRVLPEYPRPQMVRKEWLNLNGLWEFSAASSKGDPTFGTELARRILVPFPVESALSGIMESHSHVWYRRMFTVPAAWQGQRILLHFGAVNWDSAVYVNGKKLAAHQGGYDPFQIDITDALNKEGPQEL